MAVSESGRTVPPYLPWLMLAPGLAWLGFFFVVPMVSLFRKSLENEGFGNYRWVFSSNGETILRTFGYALTATIIAVIIGYPLAYFIAMKGGRFKTALLALVVLPFFTTYLIRTIAWRVLLTSQGPVPGFLRWVGIFDNNSEIIGTRWAVIGALVYNFLPFMVLPIYVSLEKVDRRLLEAGPDLYASGLRTFRRVTLPLSIPGVFAGSLLTFIPAAGDFINSELLGSDKTRMIGQIVSETFLQEVQQPRDSAISFVLMSIILLGVLIYARLLGTEDLI
jgi:spermidine/putrescine transport system permease protein